MWIGMGGGPSMWIIFYILYYFLGWNCDSTEFATALFWVFRVDLTLRYVGDVGVSCDWRMACDGPSTSDVGLQNGL